MGKFTKKTPSPQTPGFALAKLLPLLLLLTLLGCEHANRSKDVQTQDIPIQSRLSAQTWRGVCYAHSWEKGGRLGYGSEESLLSLKHLKSKNVDWVSLTPFGFMNSLSSTQIMGTHNKNLSFGETDDRIRAATQNARSQGMKVMLKPHIWIAGGKWRGQIVPKNSLGQTDWKTWWDNHNAWIIHYANLAKELKIEALVIGLELHTAVQHDPDALIRLADEVRKIYKGHITYSANWNEPVPVKVWKKMDSVGVQLYPPLQKKNEKNTNATWKKNFQSTMAYWEKMASLSKKPIILTEVGFRSAARAASHPNAWPDKNVGEESDPQLQAELYHFLLNEIVKRPQIEGVFFWKYFTNSNTKEEGPTGFSPMGKPAEHVMTKYFEKG